MRGRVPRDVRTKKILSKRAWRYIVGLSGVKRNARAVIYLAARPPKLVTLLRSILSFCALWIFCERQIVVVSQGDGYCALCIRVRKGRDKLPNLRCTWCSKLGSWCSTSRFFPPRTWNSLTPPRSVMSSKTSRFLLYFYWLRVSGNQSWERGMAFWRVIGMGDNSFWNCFPIINFRRVSRSREEESLGFRAGSL